MSAACAVLLGVGCGGRSSLEARGTAEGSATAAAGGGDGGIGGGGIGGGGGVGGIGGGGGVGGIGGGGGVGGIGGGGGVGGIGGGSPLCAFSPTLPIRSYFTQPGHRGYAPRLKASSADGQSVSLLSLQYGFPPLSAIPLRFEQVTFQPWDGWTNAPLGNSLLLTDNGPLSYATPRRAEDGITFMYATENPFTASSPEYRFLPEASVNQTQPVTAGGPSVFPLPPVAQFVTTETTNGFHGLGYLDNNGGQFKSIVSPVTAGSLGPPQMFGCATTPTETDGARLTDTILFAIIANEFVIPSVFPGTCVAAGPANQLKLFRLDANNAVELSSAITAPDNPFKHIWMLPHSSSAWLIWQMTVPQDAPLMATRININGSSLIAPFELAPAGTTFHGHGIGTVGDELLFARHQPDPNDALFVIDRRDDEGVLLETITLATDPWLPPLASEPIALHGSPDGTQFLMAYSSDVQTNEVAGNSQIFVVRFSYSCVEP